MSVESTREVRRHYQTLLAAHYAWMSGDLAQRIGDAERFFRGAGIRGPGQALDLGCGHGIQSLALARLGCHVTAVDFNTRLLAELRANAGDTTIETVEADLLDIGQHPAITRRYDTIVCMGDTLTHLPTMGDVERLIELVARRLLANGGQLVLGLRDLSVELTGVDRAIPVRLDSDRLMLAFLEYQAEHVRVHDLVLQRTDDQWRLEKSVYSKLRIAIDRLTSLVEQYDLTIESTSQDRGLYHIIARKPLE
jgi:SAM-dependent methyltransferase